MWMSARQDNMFVLTNASILPDHTIADVQRGTILPRIDALVKIVLKIPRYYGEYSNYNYKYNFFSDINECEQPGICPPPGRCINTVGNYNCICPRGFKLDPTKTFCIDQDECLDDSKCHQSCKVNTIK